MGGCYELGVNYHFGRPGVTPNPLKANVLFKKACDGDVLMACFLLGENYARGTGIEQDFNRARTVYKKACDQGETIGCFGLGKLVQRGAGGPANAQAANVLYGKACDGGVMRACATLGSNLKHGIGQKKNVVKALALYKKACDGGLQKACTWLKNTQKVETVSSSTLHQDSDELCSPQGVHELAQHLIRRTSQVNRAQTLFSRLGKLCGNSFWGPAVHMYYGPVDASPDAKYSAMTQAVTNSQLILRIGCGIDLESVFAQFADGPPNTAQRKTILRQFLDQCHIKEWGIAHAHELKVVAQNPAHLNSVILLPSIRFCLQSSGVSKADQDVVLRSALELPPIKPKK